jgi:acyl transferase domain-containing protein
MACRFPGELYNLDLLLAALRQRTVTAGPVPADRWDVAHYFSTDESAQCGECCDFFHYPGRFACPGGS